MLPNVGWSELIVIMLLALVIFGPNRLPEIARQIGRALREVRRVSGQFQDELRAGLALDDDFPYMKGPKQQPSSAKPADSPAGDPATHAEASAEQAPAGDQTSANGERPHQPTPD